MKKHWQKMAKVRAEQHILDHPNYSYTPRKPSEKKRRMKRNTATDSADATVATGSSLPHNMAVNTDVNTVAINFGETSAGALIVPEPLDDRVTEVGPAPVLTVNENGRIVATLGDQRIPVADLERTLQLYYDCLNIQPPRNEVEAAFRPFAEAQGDFTISTSHDHMIDMEKLRQGIIQQAKVLDAQYLAFDAIFDPNFLNTEHGATGIGINSTAGSITENTLLTLPVFEGFSPEELATEVL